MWSLEEGPPKQKPEWLKEQKTSQGKSLEEHLRQREQGGPGYLREHRGGAGPVLPDTCVLVAPEGGDV